MAMSNNNPDLCKEIAQKLMETPRSERGRIIAGYMNILGWSEGKIYTVAREYGYSSGKKDRADKGQTKVPMDKDTIQIGAAMIFGSKRQTDKIIMPAWKTLEILEDNGKIGQGEVSPSWFNRQLRNEKLSRERMKSLTPAISLASKHPNHVHQMDFSVCVQYDFKEKGTRWKMVDRDMQKEFYKNKPGYWKKVRKVLIRALMTDHCSGAFWVKYYYIEGESREMIVDFVQSAWGKKEDPEMYPFKGVPFILMVDPGSANTSQAFRNMMKGLRIKLEVHFPGHARVKGQVESMHGYWEEAFESELSMKKAMDIGELNTRAYDYAMYMNTTKKHKRHKCTRFGIWQLINQEQLRLMPGKEMCEELCNFNPVQAAIDGRKCIQFDGRLYQIKGPFRQGDKVWVIKNPYKEPFIEISDKKEHGEFFSVELIRTDKYGFNVNAAVIGESYKRHEADEAEKFIKAVESGEISLEGIEPKLQRGKIEKIAYIERQGTEIDLEAKKIPPPSPLQRGTEANTPPAPLDRGEHLRARDTDCGCEARVAYPRGEVFKEIRFRARLERIAPVQSQLIEKMLDDYANNIPLRLPSGDNTPPTPLDRGEMMVPDAVIEEIIKTVFRQDKQDNVGAENLQPLPSAAATA